MVNYWQISSGNGQVDMLDIFIKLNVALIGPGRYGDYFDNKYKYESLSDGHLVRKFAEEINVNDVLVLKHIKNPQTKVWNVFAAGKVAGPYRYEPVFDSVDSDKWDVQHCRRVIWTKSNNEMLVNKGGAPIRLQRIGDNNPLKEAADSILNIQ